MNVDQEFVMIGRDKQISRLHYSRPPEQRSARTVATYLMWPLREMISATCVAWLPCEQTMKTRRGMYESDVRMDSLACMPSYKLEVLMEPNCLS
jgi:hypothetical protein